MVDLMVGLIKKINEYIIQSYYHHQIHHIFQIGLEVGKSYIYGGFDRCTPFFQRKGEERKGELL
jgi:hypothetical protein